MPSSIFIGLSRGAAIVERGRKGHTDRNPTFKMPIQNNMSATVETGMRGMRCVVNTILNGNRQLASQRERKHARRAQNASTYKEAAPGESSGVCARLYCH